MTKALVRKYERTLTQIVEELRGKLKNAARGRELEEAAEVDVSAMRATIRVLLKNAFGSAEGTVLRSHLTSVQATADARVDALLKLAGMPMTATGGEAAKTIMDALLERNIAAIKGLSDGMEKDLVREISDAVANGESMDKIIKRIDAATDVGRQRAEVIARTETLYAYNAVAKDRYRRNGIEFVEWLTATDDRVCEQCGPLDGTRYEIADAPECPLHPQCRCTLIPVRGMT